MNSVLTKNKRSVIRVGDKVKILNPQFFVRCGYPWSKQYVIDHVITEDDKSELRKFVDRLAGGCTNDALFNSMEGDKCYGEMLDRLGAGVLKRNKYGGRERTLHTVAYEKFLGMTFVVADKKVVYSGHYNAGSSSLDGEFDPPYLGSAKAHIILSLSTHDVHMLSMAATDDFGMPLRIESCHVAKSEEPCA